MDDQLRAFEHDLDAALGDAIRADERFAGTVYAALCNVEWRHVERGVASYTWRSASTLIVQIRGVGGHDLSYYLFGGEGAVDPTVAEALEARGWHPTPM